MTVPYHPSTLNEIKINFSWDNVLQLWKDIQTNLQKNEPKMNSTFSKKVMMLTGNIKFKLEIFWNWFQIPINLLIHIQTDWTRIREQSKTAENITSLSNNIFNQYPIELKKCDWIWINPGRKLRMKLWYPYHKWGKY
jgi:hypothetical protein